MKYHMLYPFDQWLSADRIISGAEDSIVNNGLTAEASGLPIPPQTVEDAIEILRQVDGAEFSTETLDRQESQAVPQPMVNLSEKEIELLLPMLADKRTRRLFADRRWRVIPPNGSEVELEQSVDNAIGHKDGKDRANLVEGLEDKGKLYIP